MIEPLYDFEKAAARLLYSHGVKSRGSITTFLANCRVMRNLYHMNDQQYADTVRQSSYAYVAMFQEVHEVFLSF